MNWGNISAEKLESERSKSFAVFISLQTKAIRVSLDSSGLENIAQVRANRAECFQNHDARRAVSATLSFLKWTGARKLESESSKSVAVSILPQTKPHQQIVYSVRDIKISPKSREIEPKFVKITMRVKQSRLLF